MTKDTKVRVWIAAAVGALVAVIYAAVLGADGLYIGQDPCSTKEVSGSWFWWVYFNCWM